MVLLSYDVFVVIYIENHKIGFRPWGKRDSGELEQEWLVIKAYRESFK